MNYYEILEVSTNASKEVIKNAYRALSKKYHPDRNKENLELAEEKLKEINVAYETLIDDEKRLQYDYEIGVKVDPNAIIPEEENIIQEKDEEEPKKDKTIWVIKKKNVLVGVVIAISFVLAFTIGIKIANNSSSKKNKYETHVVTPIIEKNESSENTKKYNSNSNYNNSDIDNTPNDYVDEENNIDTNEREETSDNESNDNTNYGIS